MTWTHQRTEVIRQTAILKSEEIVNTENHSPEMLLGAEDTKTINW